MDAACTLPSYSLSMRPRLTAILFCAPLAAALYWLPMSAQEPPEVWQIVTFRFQPGQAAEAHRIYADSLLPIYRDNPHLLRFRAYREAESPVPLDLMIVSHYAGMAGMDESNRWHRRRATGGGVGPLYARLSDLSAGHDDQFIEILPSLTTAAKAVPALYVFEWIRVIPGGGPRFEQVLEARAVPWERGLSMVKGSRTGRVLVGDGWDYARVLEVDSLGDYHSLLTRAREAPFTAEWAALVAARRTIIVRNLPELAIR